MVSQLVVGPFGRRSFARVRTGVSVSDREWHRRVGRSRLDSRSGAGDVKTPPSSAPAENGRLAIRAARGRSLPSASPPSISRLQIPEAPTPNTETMAFLEASSSRCAIVSLPRDDLAIS